jgi:hypothetical protein
VTRKDRFWLTVTEGSVHGCLAPALGQNIMVAGSSGRVVSLPHGSQEAE